MASRPIFEANGKQIIWRNFKNANAIGLKEPRLVAVNESTIDINRLADHHPWLTTEKLVAKPDQLVKRRGKLGLVFANKMLAEVAGWVESKRQCANTKIGSVEGRLTNFIVEPFISHVQSEEFYVCIYSERDCDTILFSAAGGVDIDINSCSQMTVGIHVENNVNLCIQPDLNLDCIKSELLGAVADDGLQQRIAQFVAGLYRVYADLYFSYLEINPLVVTADGIHLLDLAAKLDSTADFMCRSKWQCDGREIVYPNPFGREAMAEERYISDIDAKTGASLKLTILNRNGRIWTMVAGGGASVIYADTVCSLLAGQCGGDVSALANYGEYSGAPSEQQTFDYAKTVIDLMCKSSAKDKILIVGGGIANFTNVAATFKGIVRALEKYQVDLRDQSVKIYVRRAGPNYQEGLRVMRDVGSKLGISIAVHGPETHMTSIVSMALGSKASVSGLADEGGVRKPEGDNVTTANFLLRSAAGRGSPEKLDESEHVSARQVSSANDLATKDVLFTASSRAIVWGLQAKAVQSMMDFDYVCRRPAPSVACMVYPMIGGDSKQQFYWGHKEVLVPVYKNMSDGMNKHKDADILVNFASHRSAYETTMDALINYPQIRTVAIIAEGIPDNMTRRLLRVAHARGVTIIGPATVGGVKPGCFKIGNTGGMMDNILHSKLYRPGSVAYVSRSGGMSNELNNIISRTTDGVFEGVAIGGDKYPVSTFLDHLLRYEKEPSVQMTVVLGEVGGKEEYRICEAVKQKRLTKPIVAWCIGTCADLFSTDIQFGHAGASAGAVAESATAKNAALAEAGAYVPESFDDLDAEIRKCFQTLLDSGKVQVKDELPPPPVPMDYAWARELGLIRKPASFMTSICDERGQELLYAGIPITEVFRQQMGVGGVLSLLWFQRRLPPYACAFLEMCLMITADHGPAVSGAHNTIVCARAGKDLVSSLVSGLLTIGDRFGGALDGAARHFTEAYDSHLSPMDFVNNMRQKGQLIMGIGHRVKSLNNPDMRVSLIIEYVRANFPATSLLDYALDVEKITTTKKPNLILNVDGCIAVCFVDLLRHSGCFDKDEADAYVKTGSLNGLFVLGRSIGFIGHYLDQKRLKQGLYRHPWDDISYVLPEIHQ